MPRAQPSITLFRLRVTGILWVSVEVFAAGSPVSEPLLGDLPAFVVKPFQVVAKAQSAPAEVPLIALSDCF